jgi:acid phosphatase
LTGLSLAAAAAVIGFSPASALATATPAAHYDHVFVIVEENHSFMDVIGNPAAPNLNALASRYGLATQYYGVTHPSEPNYVALLGGSPFGVKSDDATTCNGCTPGPDQ